MVNVSYNNTDATWITRDSELLAPYNTMKAHQDFLEKEGLKIEEAEAPAPIQDQSQEPGHSQGQGAGPEARYANIADDSDSDSVDMHA